MSIWSDASLSHSASILSLNPYLATWLVLRLLPAIFAGVGPPCHNWSVARFVGAGPRVVRSAERLWGLDALELRELQHVYIGNVLLQAALDICLALLLTGGSAFIEIRPNLLGILLLPRCLTIWKLRRFMLWWHPLRFIK